MITVDEDSGSVSLLVTATEDVSFRAYPETFSSATGCCGRCLWLIEPYVINVTV